LRAQRLLRDLRAVRVDAGRFDLDADLPRIAPDQREARTGPRRALADAGTIGLVVCRPAGFRPTELPWARK